MALLGIDIGGTKLAVAVFTDEGEILSREVILLGDLSRKGPGSVATETAGKPATETAGEPATETAGKPATETAGKTATEIVEKPVADKVGKLVADTIRKFLNREQPDGTRIRSIGISVPGIYRIKEGTVWAPNIPGWDNYPLLQEVEAVCGTIPVTIDSDRACYILGEMWKGNARGCSNAIFLAVGTGIGAVILADGSILRGANDIAGAIGWMALSKPFRDEYVSCGCFEHHASGEGIAKVAQEFLKEEKKYCSSLKDIPVEEITSHDVFIAYSKGDPLAVIVIRQSIEYWGMAIANLISLFNPEKIILGGGVFGPAVTLIPLIIKEAAKWAQPISSGKVSIEASALGGEAGVYGAGWLARKKPGSE